MKWHELSYRFPYAIILVLMIFAFFILFWRLYRYRLALLDRFTLMIPRSPTIFWTKITALCLGWFFLSLALMQPERQVAHPQKNTNCVLRQKKQDVIFLVDASASMAVSDTRTGKSRLEYAKEIIDAMTSQFHGENVALYAFTSQPTKLVPLTPNTAFLRLLARQLTINEGDIAGTDIKKALETIKKNYLSTSSTGLKTVIILSDGGDTELEGTASDQRLQEILETLPSPNQYNLRMFTIGMGSREGKAIPNILYQGKSVTSSVDETLLKKLSQNNRGRYYFANDTNALGISQDIYKMMQEEARFEEVKSVSQDTLDLTYDLYFQIPLGFAIICLILFLFLPDVERKESA